MSNNMASTNDFVAEQRLRISSICRKFKDNDKHLNYIIAEIELLEKYLPFGDLRNSLIKKLVCDALQFFNTHDDYKSDLRMLVLWKVLGQYSVEIKMDGIMTRVDELGFFRTIPEFYALWVEHWAQQKNLVKVNSLVEKCLENCKFDMAVELFRPIIEENFGAHCEVPALTSFINKAKLPETLKHRINNLQNQPLGRVLEVLEEKSSTQQVPEKDSMYTKPNAQQVPEKDSPYAKRMRHIDLSFNEDSLLGGDSNKEASVVSTKRSFTIADRLTAQDAKKNTQGTIFDGTFDNEMTLAAHGKFGQSQATSTPRRSKAPGLEIFSPNEEDFAALPQDDSLRGLADADCNSNQLFGSNLQRRLSVAPAQYKPPPSLPKTSDLVNALPRLCIKTPVPEESYKELIDEENKENNLTLTDVSPLKQQSHMKRVIQNENVVQKKIVIPNVCTSPWDEKERQQILKSINVLSFTQCHDFRENVCPKLDLTKKVDFGGEHFSVVKLLGQGGFAKVFQTVNSENKSYAIKWEQPPCPWEVYICDALQRRLPEKYQSFVMNIRDAYIFSNSSVIIYDYYPCGTLLDLSNHYKKQGLEMSGLLVTFFGLQLGRILEQVHAAKIIHADVKPDNIVIAAPLGLDAMSVKDLIGIPIIKLIDWGRSIDLHFTPDREFTGRAGTKCFDCIEMIYNRPWTYQTDFYGFVATIHVLIFNDYLFTTREKQKFRPVKQIKRRFLLRSMWLEIFEKFLNIPNCKSQPSWEWFNALMESELAKAANEEPQEWRKAVERFNITIKNISNA